MKAIRGWRSIVKPFMAMLIGLVATPALAGSVTGKIVSVEGHVSPACRLIGIRRDSDNALLYYRVPDTGADNSILAVAMMSMASAYKAILVYADGATTGCGSENRIDYLRVVTP